MAIAGTTATYKGDDRSLLVELTDEGKRKAEAAFREDMALETRLLAGLSDDEQTQLAALLRHLEAVVFQAPHLSLE